jgi:hypothetical protein
VVFISGSSVDAHLLLHFGVPGLIRQAWWGWGHTVGVLKPHPHSLSWLCRGGGGGCFGPGHTAIGCVLVVGGVGLLFEMWIVDASIIRRPFLVGGFCICA